MKLFIKSIMLCLVLVFTLVAYSINSVAQNNITKIFYNGKIWTGNNKQPWVDTIAVKNERIIEVGNKQIITNHPDATIYDLQGKLTLPGFIDNHTHFMDGSASLLSIQTQYATSSKEFIDLIKNYAETTPKDEWIIGGLWDHEAWEGNLPHKDWIDQFTKDKPLFLLRTDGHMAFANSIVLKLAGITKDTMDPEGGLIVRDAKTNEPTGVLKDNAMNFVWDVIPALTEQQADTLFDAGIKEALENGVTQVHNMSNWDNIEIFKRAKKQARLKIRAYYFPHISTRHKLADMIKKEGKGDDWLRFGGVKELVDGSLGSTTAWFYEPYTDEPDSNGFPLMNMAALKKSIQDAHAYGFQLAIHGIGNQTNDEILKIFEEINVKGHRPRIEHAQHLTPSAIKKFAELGVMASMQPYHAVDDGRWAEKRIGSERLKGTYAFKSLLDANATLTFGSDWSVAPLKPLLGIYAAVTRRTLDGKNPDGWVPSEKISVEQAIKAYTINNAYAGFQENDLGTIEVGKLADLVVLNANIFEIDPENIKDTKVLMTIIGGQILYQIE
jgi:predicted amidohydrolase YtcJ